MTTTTPSPIVSYSEISAGRKCLHAHNLGYVQRLRSTKPSLPLTRGTNWHLILEAHYQAIEMGTDPALRVGDQFEALRFEGLPQDEDELLSWMYTGYLERWGLDPQWDILGIEHRFQLPLPRSAKGRVYILKGTIDLVIRDEKGRYWVIDHKSGARGPAQKMLDMGDQFPLYCWALTSLGVPIYGSMHSWANTKMNVHWEKQTVESRFTRTPVARTKKEMNQVAQDAADSLDVIYGDHNNPKSPSEDNCQYTCDYFDACLHGRRGGDEVQFLTSTHFEYTERH